MEQLIAFASNNGMLSAVWVALFVMIIVTTIRMKMSPIKQISTQDLTFLMNREEGVALDVRKEKEFKAAHILDAINLSSEKISKNGFASLEKHKDKPIIVVCTAGINAAKIATDLHKGGFTRVSVLKGGMNSWTGAGLPVAK
ncbi:MAG: rhodanese-like domain-containing protein [Colwellia sp.]